MSTNMKVEGSNEGLISDSQEITGILPPDMVSEFLFLLDISDDSG